MFSRVGQEFDHKCGFNEYLKVYTIAQFEPESPKHRHFQQTSNKLSQSKNIHNINFKR